MAGLVEQKAAGLPGRVLVVRLIDRTFVVIGVGICVMALLFAAAPLVLYRAMEQAIGLDNRTLLLLGLYIVGAGILGYLVIRGGLRGELHLSEEYIGERRFGRLWVFRWEKIRRIEAFRPGGAGYSDAIMIYGTPESEHGKPLKNCLEIPSSIAHFDEIMTVLREKAAEKIV